MMEGFWTKRPPMNNDTCAWNKSKITGPKPLRPGHDQADATPYLDRSFTRWIAPACGWRTYSITLSARRTIGGAPIQKDWRARVAQRERAHFLGESERVGHTPTRLDAKSAPVPGSNRVDGAYCPSRRLAWRCTSRHSPSSSRKTCVTLFDHCVGRSMLATRALNVSISVV